MIKIDVLDLVPVSRFVDKKNEYVTFQIEKPI